MKKYCGFLFFAVYLLTIPMLNAQDYPLVWSDEFDGTEINTQTWTYDIGGHGWGNGEAQYYTSRSANSYLENGYLVIKALKENYSGMEYTSARLKTQGRKFWTYGKIEARIKLPYGQGIWPAFWMLGESFATAGWPACGEIDILELVGGTYGDNKVHATIHFDDNGYRSWGGSYVLSSGRFADDFHVFTLHWTPEKLEWFIDGHLYYDADIQANSMSEFHKDFFIILNCAVGGGWPGYPDATTVFPQTMMVDYVRVYQDTLAQAVVTISEPENNSSFSEGSAITLGADVVYDGEIDKVEFYQGNTAIGETALYPYQMTWRDVLPGNYQISARAIISNGIDIQSDAAGIKVGSGTAPSPYKGYASRIPGSIEAENFDLGGINVAYYDSDALNSGYQYRTTESVDIERCSDAGEGYNVGWTAANEWLLYTVNCAEAGLYAFDIRVAAESSGGSFHLELDNSDITGKISVPASGGWQNWTTVSINNISLPEGIHKLKFVVETSGFNFNKMDIYKEDGGAEIVLIAPNGGETWAAGSIQEIRWYSSWVENVSITLSEDDGSTWSDIEDNASSEYGSYRWRVPDLSSTECLLRIENLSNTAESDQSDAVFAISNSVSSTEDASVIGHYALMQNYPNPFNPVTRIPYSLAKPMDVRLTISDVSGAVIKSWVLPSQAAGQHEILWNGCNTKDQKVATGIYIYRMEAGDFVETKKMVFMK